MLVLVGAGVAWVGYTAVWWGWERLGGEVDLLDLVIPGRPWTPSRDGAAPP